MPVKQDLILGGLIVVLLVGGCVLEGWRDGRRGEERALLPGWLAALLAAILLLVALIGVRQVHARDVDGRYARDNPALHDWFDGLASRKGPCCSDADGTRVSDPDWNNDDGHYRVRVDGTWYDVPDEALITEPNRVGFAVVWPLYYYVNGEPDHSRKPFGIRCFMPGSMT